MPSPKPKRIFEIRPIKWLLEKGTIVICAGGGGILTMYGEDGKLRGIEAVIDKDLASSLLAQQLDSDLLVIATDAMRRLSTGASQPRKASPTPTPTSWKTHAASGSMGPKVEAACEFARKPARPQ